MIEIAGKYVAEKDENLGAYFKAHGLNDEQLQDMLNVFKELEITASCSEYTILSGLGNRSFPLEKEVDEKLCDNLLKSTASLSGNKLLIRSVGKDGKIRERVYEATDNGLTLSSAFADRAKVYYKRV